MLAVRRTASGRQPSRVLPGADPCEMLQGAAGLRRGWPDGVGGLDPPHEKSHPDHHRVAGHVSTPGIAGSRASRLLEQLDPGNRRPGPRAGSGPSGPLRAPGREGAARHPSAGDVLVDEHPHAPGTGRLSRINRSIARLPFADQAAGSGGIPRPPPARSGPGRRGRTGSPVGDVVAPGGKPNRRAPAKGRRVHEAVRPRGGRAPGWPEARRPHARRWGVEQTAIVVGIVELHRRRGARIHFQHRPRFACSRKSMPFRPMRPVAETRASRRIRRSARQWRESGGPARQRRHTDRAGRREPGCVIAR